jgi:8-oxo-dGTP diphosphatase
MQEQIKQRPKIGLTTIVIKNGLILIGKRKNSHGEGTWNFPGGHLEYLESFIDCAKRELYEETGLIADEDVKYISNQPVAITNDFFKEENKHYITLHLQAKQISKKFAKIIEPDKCECWEYTHWNNLIKGKDKLFLPLQNLIKQNYNPYQLKCH